MAAAFVPVAISALLLLATGLTPRAGGLPVLTGVVVFTISGVDVGSALSKELGLIMLGSKTRWPSVFGRGAAVSFASYPREEVDQGEG